MFQALVETASYMAHGYCLLWQPWLVVLYAGSDILIFLAYSAIPLALLRFLRRRPDVRYGGLVALFAAFILLCGITHAISVLTLWVPLYPLHGAVKLVTGLVSATTAVVLFLLVPRLVAIPSPRQLEAAHARLRQEIDAHEETLNELRAAKLELEEKVAARTADLAAATEQLEVVTREAVHRSRNVLSMVLSIARQTARGAPDVNDFMSVFAGRLEALSRATSTVTEGRRKHGGDLAAVLETQLEHIRMTYGGRVSLAGEPVEVCVEAAQQLSLMAHELATNAIKYGALAGPEGRVSVTWRILDRAADPRLEVTWAEHLGPAGRPAADLPRAGFGSELLTRLIPTMLGGFATRSLECDGLRYRLVVPLRDIVPKEHEAARNTASDEMLGRFVGPSAEGAPPD